jgi:diguanylate cyclase (GGDEF)-like protein/PAS domain S-box-containing protein
MVPRSDSMHSALFSRLMKNPQLLISFFGFLILNAAIGIIAYVYSQKSEALFYAQTFRQLRSVTDIKHHKLELFFSYRTADIRALAASETVINLTRTLHELDTRKGLHTLREKGRKRYTEAVRVHEKYHRYLNGFLKEYVYTNLLLVDTVHGDVFFSTDVHIPVGTGLASGMMGSTRLATLWKNVIANSATQISDIHADKSYSAEPTMFLGTPVIDEGEVLAVLILQLPGNAINEIMHFRSSMGESGESYAVGQDYLMRSDSFLFPDRFSVVNSFAHPESACVRTDAVRAALSGREGSGVITDYRNIPVLSAYKPFKWAHFTWAIISEIDESELTRQIRAVQHDIYLLALAVSLGIILLAYFIIRAIIRVSVIRPLEQSYHRAREFEELIDNSLNEIYIFGKEDRHYIYANRAALLNTGHGPEEMRRITPLDIVPEFSAESFGRLLAPLLQGKREQIVFETVHRRTDGSRYDVEVRLQLMAIEGEQKFVAVVNDITERKRAQEEKEHFYHLSTYDHLTQVYNRQKFDELYERELERSRRYRGDLALILFDVDRFKEVNDSCGHHVGDLVLKRLSRYVQESIRESDIFARWGGEEFVILMPHTTLETAQEKAEHLRREIGELSFGEAGSVSCSFGVTAVDPYEPMSATFQRADAALYRAKSEGRNRVCTG